MNKKQPHIDNLSDPWYCNEKGCDGFDGFVIQGGTKCPYCGTSRPKSVAKNGKNEDLWWDCTRGGCIGAQQGKSNLVSENPHYCKWCNGPRI